MIQVDSTFAKYQLTEEEMIQALQISPLTRAFLQNLLADAAEDLVANIFKSKLEASHEREAMRYTQGQIDLLKKLLADVDAVTQDVIEYNKQSAQE